MREFFVLFLFVLGTLFGSFASVLIYRLKSGEKGIVNGRSHCSSCQRILSGVDLIPIVSYVLQRGRCRTCEQKISSIYPLLECSMGITFAMVGWFLIDAGKIFSGDIFSWVQLFFFLGIVFVSIVYTFYDILFMEIPEQVIGIGNISVFIFGVVMMSFPFFLGLMNFSWEVLFSIVLSATVLGGLYVILLRELETLYDILILSFLGLLFLGFHQISTIPITTFPLVSGAIGAYAIFIFFYLQILISSGKWIGGGDLRIAIFIGYILGIQGIFSSLLTSYIVGSIFGISFILYKKYIQKIRGKINTMIPFGPFLAVGMLYTLFFGSILRFFTL